jgi:hypothetical protein
MTINVAVQLSGSVLVVCAYSEHFAHNRKTNSFNGVQIRQELGEVSGN